MTSFFHELRRRNVLKVAAGYALVAWILIEPATELLPRFGAPEWFVNVYIVMVLAGFVVSMIIAWVFEITPDGVKLERDVDRENYVPPKGGSHYGLIILLFIALGVSLTFNLTDFLEHAEEETPNGVEEQRSVVLLPFENRSTDPENGFFADGLRDDLRRRLAMIDSLHVISNTSANAYRERSKTLADIGRELDVDTIVEGSVARAGNEIRVIVTVYEAATENNLFSETYDRDASLQNVFELQSDISSEILTALRARAVSQEERQIVTGVPTEVPAAFAAYVGGVNLLEQREFSTLLKARELFEEAVELDPNYARAYAKLAETVMVLMINHNQLQKPEAWRIAGEAVDRALEIDPQLPEAWAVRGLIEMNRWQQERLDDGNVRAAAAFETALSLNNNLSTAYTWYGALREDENRLDEAIDLMVKAMDIDPRNRIPYVNLPGLLALRGQQERATEILLETMDSFPGWPMPFEYLARHLEKSGRLDESVAWNLRLREASDDPMAGSSAFAQLVLFGHGAEVDEFIDSFPDGHPVYPIARGYRAFIEQDFETAIDILRDIDADEIGTREFVYPLIARAALRLNRYDEAREYLLLNNPKLASDAINSVDRFNADTAVWLAYVEQNLGNTTRARDLLAQAFAVTEKQPRVGYWGHGIRDVKILTLQGRVPMALERFRDAVDQGFVSQIPYEFWDIDDDPVLVRLRDTSEYEALRAEMQERLDAMKKHVDDALATGDWSDLLARANTG